MKELKEYSVAVLSVIGAGAICYGAYGVAQEKFEEYVRDTANEVVYDSYAVKHLQERVAYLEVSRMAERGDEFADSILEQLKGSTEDNQALIDENRAFQKAMSEKFGGQTNDFREDLATKLAKGFLKIEGRLLDELQVAVDADRKFREEMENVVVPTKED